MFAFNLIVTYSFGFLGARREAYKVLTLLGDETPVIRRTNVKVIIGVLTSLDPHKFSTNLIQIATEKPNIFYFTQRWIPIDLWTFSDIPSMKEGVKKVAILNPLDSWMMVVEKRKYKDKHSDEIVKELADVIIGKVDLKNPERILRIDILGPFAGISLLRPDEIFSALRLFS